MNKSTCGNISISGGTVTATGKGGGAGIGTGQTSSICGNITITDGVTYLIATKGADAPASIGIGRKNYSDTCGTVTIGGVVYWDGLAYQNGGDNEQTGIVKSPYYYPIQNYTLTNIPSGWTVTADGQTVPLTDGNASIQSGATVVLTPSGSDKPRVKSVTLTDPLTISLTVTKLTDGSWTFTMPVGNRTLNVEWWGMCDLAWMLGDQPVPSGGVTVCLGFENLLTLPTLSNPHNLDVRYGSTNENVARFDEDGFIIIDELSAGTTTIYAVHDADEDYLYDSAYYMLTVLAPDTLTLAVNNSAMGAVSLVDTPDHVIPITTTAGTFKVIPGTNVNVTATPAEHHYMQKWNNEAALNSNVAVNTTFTVTKDTTLTAYFVHKPILTLKSNPSSGNAGHVDVDSVNHALPAGVVASNDTVYKYIVDYDTTVTVKAIPAPHYHLASWNTIGGNELQQVVTMTSDMEITGVFAIDTFTLTLKTNDINKGTVEVTNHNGNPAIVSHDPDANGTRTYKVNHGAEVIIKATPKNHYYLVSWSNGATFNADNTIHVIVTTDSTITANFDTVSYSIAATANPAEGGTVTGAGTYKHFTTATMTATSATNYSFVNWTEDGDEVSTSTTYSFEVTGARTLVANFKLNSYDVTASVANTADVRGTVKIAYTGVNGQSQTTAAGATVQASALSGSTSTLTAIPALGYHFVNWQNNAGATVSNSNPINITSTVDTSLTAVFDTNSYTITYMDGETELKVDTFKYRQTITEYTTSKEGWDFIGWSPAVPDQMPAENLVVYAKRFLICNPVTDIDNNTYPSVNIGNICWMTVNMKATHYADGREITNIYEYESPMYPNVAENVDINGRLYDWYDAVDASRPAKYARVRGICPNGWYIPNEEDVAVLNAIPATELHSTTRWLLPNDNTNSTGFTAYPAGMYNLSLLRYEGMGTETSWWSTITPHPSLIGTSTGTVTAKAFCTAYYCDTIFIKSYPAAYAISVRCVKHGE